MRAVFFLLYIAIGAGLGFGLQWRFPIDLVMAGAAGTATTLLLGQAHLFLFSRPSNAHKQQLSEALAAQESTSRRVNVLEARTDAVETSLKHELTERRDALVAEMRQLEGLIERLSAAVTARGANGSAAAAAPAGAQVNAEADKSLADVRSALEADRIDLHLQPIMTLPQRRLAFYEGMARLRRENGSLIMPNEFIGAARRARLLGMIDALTLFRCVQIVRRLVERDRSVGVICNISEVSLEDEDFFPVFLEFISDHTDLAGSIVFEMSADGFFQRTRAMRANMERLSALGFRFSLDQAETLDIDLPRLQDAGVRFVKFTADRLLAQLRDPEGPRPTSAILAKIIAADVSAVFSRYGITMMAEYVNDEASVLELLEYGVPFGQGQVFGSPRPIKASLMEETAPPREFHARLTAAE